MLSRSNQDGNAAAPGMWCLTAGILLTAFLVWWILGRWVASASERFYLLIPPVALALACRTGYRRRKGSIFLLLLVGAILAVMCVAYNLSLTAPLFPASRGFWRGLSLKEVALTLYFVLAVYLLALVSRGALRPALLRLIGDATRFLPRGQWLVSVLAVEAILLAGFAPILVSTFHVHRFKVPNPARPAELVNRSFDNVEFIAADGMTLRGWFVPASRPSRRTLLICHGMGCNRTAVLKYIAVADALGAHVLLFDFRGHGDSDGHTLSFGDREKLDVMAAVGFLRSRHADQAKEIIGLGISMGTAGLIGAAAELQHPLDALVLDSGFAVATVLADNLLQDVPERVRSHLVPSALSLASLDAACWLPEIRPVDRLGQLKTPILVIHALGDQLIPAAHAQRLYDAARCRKALWLTDTGDHGSSFDRRGEYLDRVVAFVQSNRVGQ